MKVEAEFHPNIQAISFHADAPIAVFSNRITEISKMDGVEKVHAETDRYSFMVLIGKLFNREEMVQKIIAHLAVE